VAQAADSCLPSNSSELVSRLVDHISSCGIVTAYVLDAAADKSLPSDCDQLVPCCDTVTGWQRTSCYDLVESSVWAPTHCNDALTDPMSSWSTCPAGGAADAGSGGTPDASTGSDADAGTSSLYKLCCYNACEYMQCT
jgi:hypothetical protein